MKDNTTVTESSETSEVAVDRESLSFIQKIIFSKLYANNLSIDSKLSEINLVISGQEKRMRVNYHKKLTKIKFFAETFNKFFKLAFYLLMTGMVLFIIWAIFLRDNIYLKEFSTNDFSIMVPNSGRFVMNQKNTANSKTYVWSKDNNYKLSYIKSYVYYFDQSVNKNTIESMANSFDNYYNEQYLNKDMINNWRVKNVAIHKSYENGAVVRNTRFDVYDKDRLVGIQKEKHLYLEKKEIATIIWSYEDEKNLISKTDEILNSFKN